MEDIILNFWKCSLNNDFSDFDWDEAFNEYYPYLENNCIQHGQGTFEQYLDFIDSIYSLDSMENDIPEDWSIIQNDFMYTSKSQQVRNLLKYQYDCLREDYENDIHAENAKLLKEIDNRKGLSQPELIQLFDKCIHAQHISGNILEDIDIESLREDAESEYEEEQEKFVTNIRSFL